MKMIAPKLQGTTTGKWAGVAQSLGVNTAGQWCSKSSASAVLFAPDIALTFLPVFEQLSSLAHAC